MESWKVGKAKSQKSKDKPTVLKSLDLPNPLIILTYRREAG
jgi:hypothetical protein